MANDFSGGSSCKALWRFEPGALDVNSIGGNPFILNGSPVSGTDFQEGSGSIRLVTSSNQWAYITEANLPSGFPLTSGDSVKQATFLIRVNPTSSGSARQLISKIISGSLSFWICIYYNELIIYWGYGGSSFYTYNTNLPQLYWDS